MTKPSRRIFAVLGLAAILGAAAVGLLGSPARAAGDCTPAADWGAQRDDLAAATVQLVNAHRATLGLPQLVVVPALQGSAVWKARHMARYAYMAHSDPAPPVARSTQERMTACGYTASWGENIAYGYPTARAVVDGWLASPGHRQNIENPSFVGIGSGAATSASGQVYWAHTFGTSASGGSPVPPLPPPPPPPPPPPSPAPPPPPAPAPPPPSPAPPAPTPPRATPPPPAPAPAPSPSPGTPTPPQQPQPTPARATAVTVSIALHGLALTPRRPQAGGLMSATVEATKRGQRLLKGRVYCSARLNGRPVAVETRRLRAGVARCTWALPQGSGASTVAAVVIVQQGRLRAVAPFRVAVG
jgi:uncharacterized protein YkwD